MSVAYNPNHRPAAPQGRPESIVSEVSEDDPETAQRIVSRGYVPSLSSDKSYNYPRRADSLTEEASPSGPKSKENQKPVSPSQASESGNSLSEIAEAYKNHAIITGNGSGSGRRTPRPYERERGEITSEVIAGLQDEIERMRVLLEEEQRKREEMKEQFNRLKDNIIHNTKQYIRNSTVDLKKNHQRIYPLLNDDGIYPDMVVFPTTVGALMKLNGNKSFFSHV
ncbi:hypothetical protein AA313_de0201169 [Arthrobotrys entomopaga]|nr:hypothetical protein AA313_de0201169 [Arthrobotrys entomopaga]